jgi:hypothetical protein
MRPEGLSLAVDGATLGLHDDPSHKRGDVSLLGIEMVLIGNSCALDYLVRLVDLDVQAGYHSIDALDCIL